MAFLHSVIGDNTPENREHLEKIGAKLAEGMSIDYKYLYVYVAFSDEYCYYSHNDRQPPRHVINCIGNPQLFKAVSAMRDDSDYMQFFVSKGWRDAYDDPIPDKWVLCTSNTLEEFGNVNNSPNSYSIPIFGWIKATLADLQSHFQRV